MPLRRPWWREPAVHFVLLGAMIFALDAWHSPRDRAREVVVSSSYLRGFREDFNRRNGRLPTPSELRAEADRFVREEVLYREALSLGLDRGDLIVRRRLVQKMEFLFEDTAPPPAPDESALGRYLDAHPERYSLPSRLSFTQVFFDRGRRAERLSPEALSALGALRRGADPTVLGDAFVQGNTWTEAELPRIQRELGEGFARALSTAELSSWQGPFESPYGLHLVRVTSRSEASLPALAAIRERVTADLRTDSLTRSNREAFGEILRGYSVRIEAP